MESRQHIQWLRKVLARFYHLRGATHRHLGNTGGSDLAEHQLAVNDFSRAIELDPDYAEAYFSRGVLYWRELRNAYRAIRDMTRVLELEPQWAEALFNRAMAYQIRGDHEQAIADLEQYLTEGSHPYWRESAERQLGLLREIAAERKARRDSKTWSATSRRVGRDRAAGWLRALLGARQWPWTHARSAGSRYRARVRLICCATDCGTDFPGHFELANILPGQQSD